MLIKKMKLIKEIMLVLFTVIAITLTTKISLDFLCVFIFVNVLTVLIMVYEKEQPFNFFFLFISFLALFHFGQVFLKVFSFPITTSHAYDLFSLYSAEKLSETLIYCLIVFNIIASVGYFVVHISRERNKLRDEYIKDGHEVYYFGKIMFWVLLLPIILFDVTMISSALEEGYMARYTYEYSFLSDVDMYFPFAIICMISGGNKQRKWKCYYGYALVRMIFQMLIVGNRSVLILYLILYEISRQTFQNVNKKKTMYARVIYIGAILAVCIMISFVAVIRGGNRISLDMFFKEYNIFSLFFSEFGSTLVTPILAGQYVTTFGSLSGKNYLGALLGMLPLSSIYLSDIRSYMNIGAVLNPYSPSGGALGGSLIADMIMGFQAMGVLIAVPLGIVVAKVSKTISNFKNRGFMQCAILYMSYGLLLYVRGNAEDVAFSIKRTIYIGIVYYVYSCYIKKRRKNS